MLLKIRDPKLIKREERDVQDALDRRRQLANRQWRPCFVFLPRRINENEVIWLERAERRMKTTTFLAGPNDRYSWAHPDDCVRDGKSGPHYVTVTYDIGWEYRRKLNGDTR